MNCKNCNQSLNSNFCAHCGQSAKVSRINFTSFASELSGSIFQINRGLFYTIKELFVRPGHSIREYLEGKRKNHFKPIAYAFTLSTIYFLLSRLFESPTFINDAMEGFAIGVSDTGEGAHGLKIIEWFAKNYAYTILLLLPMYALASFIAFREAGWNYLEHCVLNAYIIGQQAIIYSIYALGGVAIDDYDVLVNLTLLISGIYTFTTFWQFFDKPSRLGVMLRTILTYFLSLIFLTIMLIIVIALSGVK